MCNFKTSSVTVAMTKSDKVCSINKNNNYFSSLFFSLSTFQLDFLFVLIDLVLNPIVRGCRPSQKVNYDITNLGTRFITNEKQGILLIVDDSA